MWASILGHINGTSSRLFVQPAIFYLELELGRGKPLPSPSFWRSLTPSVSRYFSPEPLATVKTKMATIIFRKRIRCNRLPKLHLRLLDTLRNNWYLMRFYSCKSNWYVTITRMRGIGQILRTVQRSEMLRLCQSYCNKSVDHPVYQSFTMVSNSQLYKNVLFKVT